MKAIGVLALQGDFQKHQLAVEQLGYKTIQVRTSHELDQISGIIIPGGESTALLKLLEPEFKADLIHRIATGMPTLATCAGIILLANKVHNPEQESFNLLNISVTRNAFGRQLDSFIEPKLVITDRGNEIISQKCKHSSHAIEGIFIRAPRISDIGIGVEILAKVKIPTSDKDSKNYFLEPVLIKQGNILGATFHPELSEGKSIIHEVFANLSFA
jgi:pyridoxal 5'-phosphate synthase pdxT subunit